MTNTFVDKVKPWMIEKLKDAWINVNDSEIVEQPDSLDDTIIRLVFEGNETCSKIMARELLQVRKSAMTANDNPEIAIKDFIISRKKTVVGNQEEVVEDLNSTKMDNGTEKDIQIGDNTVTLSKLLEQWNNKLILEQNEITITNEWNLIVKYKKELFSTVKLNNTDIESVWAIETDLQLDNLSDIFVSKTGTDVIINLVKSDNTKFIIEFKTKISDNGFDNWDELADNTDKGFGDWERLANNTDNGFDNWDESVDNTDKGFGDWDKLADNTDYSRQSNGFD